VGIISFLRAEVESLFEHLGTFGDAVREKIATYRAASDARLGAVYGQRRVFEESVTRIGDTISSYLDLEEQAAQDIFPHYFEKQKTDGVDTRSTSAARSSRTGASTRSISRACASGSSMVGAASPRAPTG